MKIRGVKLDSLFTHAMGKNSGDGYAKEFLECFNADTVLFSESIVSFLKAPTGGKINIAAYNKYNNLNPKTLRLNTYFNCDDIIALSVNGLKKSVPVAVYKIDIGTDSVFEDGGLEIDLSHSLAKGLVSICRSEFENDNKVEFIDNVDDEEYGISEKLTLFFEKNKKIFDKFPSFFEGIKNIFSKKLRIEDILISVSAPVAFGAVLLMIGLIFYFVFVLMDRKFDAQLEAMGELKEEASGEEFKFSDLGMIFTSKMF